MRLNRDWAKKAYNPGPPGRKEETMPDPKPPASLFPPDKEVERWTPAPWAGSATPFERRLARLDGDRRVLKISPPHPGRELERADGLRVRLVNLGAAPLLAGIVFEDRPSAQGMDPPCWTSGGREPVAPGQRREIFFPREGLERIGPAGTLSQAENVILVLHPDKDDESCAEIQVELERLWLVRRYIRPGPRLSREGLQVLSSGFDPASLSRMIQGRMAAGDPLMLARPCHPFPVEDRPELLDGLVMGRKIGFPPDWTGPAGDGFEHRHHLHRHHFLHPLTRLVLAGDQDSAEKIKCVITSWIMAHPVPYESNGGAAGPWQTLGAAWRLRNWLPALAAIFDCGACDEDFQSLALRSVWEHASHLLGNQGHPCNWIMVESAALALAGMGFPNFRDAPLWLEQGVERLSRAVEKQFFADGVHFELSPRYHSICLQACLEVFLAAKSLGLEPPACLAPVLRRGAEFLRGIERPDGALPGINDSGQADRLHAPLLSCLQRLFSPGPDQGPIISRCGGLTLFRDGGLAVMRSGPGSSESYLLFRAGSAGAVHAHEDVLSLELYSQGEPRLVDPGIASYDPSEETRLARTARAHSCPLVNGRGAVRGRLGWSERIAPCGGRLQSRLDRSALMVRGVCPGPWKNAEGDVRLERWIFFVRSSYWLVWDRLEADQEASFTVGWRFGPGRVKELDHGRLIHLGNKGGAFHLVPIPGRNKAAHDPGGGDWPARPYPTANLAAYEFSPARITDPAWLLVPMAETASAPPGLEREERGGGGVFLRARWPDGVDTFELDPSGLDHCLISTTAVP